MLAANRTCAQGIDHAGKPALESGEFRGIDVEGDGRADVPVGMAIVKPDDRVGQDQSVLADLAHESDFEAEGSASIVAVGHADEGSVSLRFVSGFDNGEVQGGAVMDQVDGAGRPGGRSLGAGEFPFLGFGLGKYLAAAQAGGLHGLLVGDEAIVAPDDTQNVPVRLVDNRLFAGHADVTVSAKSGKNRAFFHRKQ